VIPAEPPAAAPGLRSGWGSQRRDRREPQRRPGGAAPNLRAGRGARSPADSGQSQRVV